MEQRNLSTSFQLAKYKLVFLPNNKNIFLKYTIFPNREITKIVFTHKFNIRGYKVMNRFVLSCLILFFFLYGVDINKLLAEQTKTNIAQDISLLRVKTREISQLYKKYEPTEKKEVRQQIEQQIKQLQQEENQIKEKLVAYGEKVIPEIIKSLETVTEKDDYFAETLVNVLQEIGEPSLPAVLTALKKAKSSYEKIVLLSFFNVNYIR
jgi:septal ring factor EnvC (AmiA/AmiB activator)